MKIVKTTDKSIQQQALDLAIHVFLEFEAPEYSNEGIEDAGKVLVRGVKEKGDIRNTDALERAFELGRTIH